LNCYGNIEQNTPHKYITMPDTAIYPWMLQQWHQILHRYQAGQLPHALLLNGPSGLGKLHFADRLAGVLLCNSNKNLRANQPLAQPCGQCQGCHLLAAGNHPDFKRVVPEEQGKQIPIDTIREVNRFLTLKSQIGGLQIVIIAPAEAMNTYAANSLLKTLEEPTAQSLLLLITSQPSRLLATLRSRCQNIDFIRPDATQALTWLQSQPDVAGDAARLLTLADGAPLLAQEFARNGTVRVYQQLLASLEKISKKQADPISEAKLWETAGYAHSLKWLYFWVSGLIRLKSLGGRVDIDHNSVWQEPDLEFLADTVNSQQLYRFLDKIVSNFRWVNSSANVQLAMEDLLISWSQLQSN